MSGNAEARRDVVAVCVAQRQRQACLIRHDDLAVRRVTKEVADVASAILEAGAEVVPETPLIAAISASALLTIGAPPNRRRIRRNAVRTAANEKSARRRWLTGFPRARCKARTGSDVQRLAAHSPASVAASSDCQRARCLSACTSLWRSASASTTAASGPVPNRLTRLQKPSGVWRGQRRRRSAFSLP
jgi:hypothetical protein